MREENLSHEQIMHKLRGMTGGDANDKKIGHTKKAYKNQT